MPSIRVPTTLASGSSMTGPGAAAPSPSTIKPSNAIRTARNGASDPERHQHVLDARVFRVEHQGRAGRVGEAELGGLAGDLAGDVQEVAGVETDLETLA